MKLDDRFLVMLFFVSIIVVASGILALVSDAAEPEGYVQVGPIVFDVTTTTTSSPAVKIRGSTTGLQIVKDAVGTVIDNTLTFWVTKLSAGSTSALSASTTISSGSNFALDGSAVIGSDLSVSGKSTITGDETIGGTLGVTGIIRSTTIRAQSGNGMSIVDDAGTLGLHIADGGPVSIVPDIIYATSEFMLNVNSGVTAQNTDHIYLGRLSRGLLFGNRGDGNYYPSIQSVKAQYLPTHMILNPEGGNTGIGEISPSTILDVVAGSSTDPVADAWDVHVSGASDEIRNKWRKADSIMSATGESIPRSTLHKMQRPMPRTWQYEPGYWQKSREELDAKIGIEIIGATRETVLDSLEAEEATKEQARIDAGEYEVRHETLISEETPDEFVNFDENGHARSFKTRKIKAWLVRELNRILDLENKARNRIVTLENDLAELAARQQKKNAAYNARLTALEEFH